MAAALADDIAAVRAFNRFYTRRINVLEEAYLGGGCTLGKSRVLYELGRTDGLTAKRLGEMLGLDGGYISRILRRFEEIGLMERRSDPYDRRSWTLHLTESGRDVFIRLNVRSEAEAGRLINGMDAERRTRLTKAMRAVRELLGPDGSGEGAEVAIRAQRPGDMGWIVQRHAELYALERGWGPLFEALVADVCAEFVRNFDPARERCWIAEQAGERLGCVFLKNGEGGTAKLRMLLVEPCARGAGLGRRLVAECVGFARASRYREITLWTQSVLTTARKLYAEAGFQLVASEPHTMWGEPLVGETWRLEL